MTAELLTHDYAGRYVVLLMTAELLTSTDSGDLLGVGWLLSVHLLIFNLPDDAVPLPCFPLWSKQHRFWSHGIPNIIDFIIIV